MEKLKLEQENGLRIYCFSLKPQSVFDAARIPTDAKFFLGYDLEGVHEEVEKRFGATGLDIVMHCDIPFKEMLDKVELPVQQAVLPMPARTPEYNRMQFMNGLRLVMDRYVESPDDRETLGAILDRVDIERSNEKINQ